MKSSSTKRLLLTFTLFFFTILFFFSPFFLKKFAKGLISTDSLNKADAVVVLSGDSGFRILKAIELYHTGYANKMIISGNKIYNTSHPQLMSQLAQIKLVPYHNIFLEEHSLSTWDHPRYIEPILTQQNFKKLIVVTSYFHTKRVRHIFNQYYKEKNVSIIVVGAYDGIDYNHWWKDHNMTEAILIEWAKTIWYFLFK